MTIYFCDIEANGLLEDATKIHCLSVKPLHGKVSTHIGDYSTHIGAFNNDDTLVWHNGFGYDLPLLEKLLITRACNINSITLPNGIVRRVQLIDSLALSREYWPDNPRGHNLEAWAKFLGTHKPFIEDWENLPVEEYIERCENDVITTEKVFLYLADKLGIET